MPVPIMPVPVALVQEAAPAPPKDEIIVFGTRDTPEIDIAPFVRAQKAYAKDKSRFAPASQLWFRLRSPSGAALPLDGLTLTLVGHGRNIAVPITADNRFQLPELRDKGWKLLPNHPQGEVAVRAQVVSDGTSEGDWRLGDLRLQCRVNWALIEKSLILSPMFDLIGGCSSSKIDIRQSVSHDIAEASVREDGRSTDLAHRKRDFRLPTFMKAYGNEARVIVRFDGSS